MVNITANISIIFEVMDLLCYWNSYRIVSQLFTLKVHLKSSRLMSDDADAGGVLKIFFNFFISFVFLCIVFSFFFFFFFTKDK